MDVDKEVRAAQHRLRVMGIKRLLEAEDKAAGIPELPEPTAMEILGMQYRMLNDALVEAAQQFARGWNAAGR